MKKPFEVRLVKVCNDVVQSDRVIGLFDTKEGAIEAAKIQVQIEREHAADANAKGLRGRTIEPEGDWMYDENDNITVLREVIAYEMNDRSFESIIPVIQHVSK